MLPLHSLVTNPRRDAVLWQRLGTLGGEEGFGKRFLFTVIRKKDLGGETMNELFRVLSWSLNVCLTGIMPDQDWNLSPLQGGKKFLAEGWRGACVRTHAP